MVIGLGIGTRIAAVGSHRRCRSVGRKLAEASAPCEPAIAVALPASLFVAANETPPPAVRLLPVVAVAVSLSTLMAMAAPIAALTPSALAFAEATLPPL